MLDSGADQTTIPYSLAEILGLDLSGEERKINGIGGLIRAKSTSAQIRLQKGHERYTFKIPVCVLLDDKLAPPPLLGREGFFNKFRIVIDEAAGKVVLKRK